MQIEDYFEEIQSVINSCHIVRLTNIAYEKRGTYEGLIRGELYFADSSILHFREFIDVEITVERLMYAYQYIKNSNDLVFRYDTRGITKKREFRPILITNMKGVTITSYLQQHPN